MTHPTTWAPPLQNRQPERPHQQTVEGRIFRSVNFEPITLKGVLSSNPLLLHVYTDEAGQEPSFTPVAKKVGSAVLETFYQLGRESLRWLGRVGMPADPSQSTQKEINLATIRELLGYSLYQELGRGLFGTPRTFLARQPIVDLYTDGHALATAWKRKGISESLRVMSQEIEGAVLFSQAYTPDGNKIVPFMTFIKTYHRPPDTVCSPTGQLVSLHGMVELLTVIRALGDVNGLGAQGECAGFIWKRNSEGSVIAAQAVKVDASHAFRFHSLNHADSRDIPVAKEDPSLKIEWHALTTVQKECFLATLLNCLRYKNNPSVLHLLFYRQGKLSRNPSEEMPKEVAQQCVIEMQQWLTLQEKVYASDLKSFQVTHCETSLRIKYIDSYGELSLPASHETFPIRELFTQLVIVEHAQQRKKERDSSSKSIFNEPEVPERDSLRSAFDSIQKTQEALTLEDLFISSKTPPVRKILLLGVAGIGKSTLCQKIAHDFSSGRLWSGRFIAVYWLSLRACNSAMAEGGILSNEDDAEKWLARAVAGIILENVASEESIKRQMREHRQEILVLLDGLDEATPAVARKVRELFDIPELTILVTSRPGSAAHLPIDRTVENIGFSDSQIDNYVDRFFRRQKEVQVREKKAFLSAIHQDVNLFGLAHIPLILQMLCVLWEKGGAEAGFPNTLTKLYQHITKELFDWYYAREDKDPHAISPNKRKKLFSCLGEIAKVGLENGRLLIPAALVDQICDQHNLKRKDLLSSGLVKATGEGLALEYYFIHLSFQEYLLAFATSQDSPENLQVFISNHRHLPSFQLVMSFLAGLIFEQSPRSIEPIKNFFRLLQTSNPLDHFNVELLSYCLNECPNPDLYQWIEATYGLKSFILQTFHHHILQLHDQKAVEWLVRLFQRAPMALSRIKNDFLDALWKSLPNTYALLTLEKMVPTLSQEQCTQTLSLLPKVLKETENDPSFAIRVLGALIIKVPLQIPLVIEPLLRTLKNSREAASVLAYIALEQPSQIPYLIDSYFKLLEEIMPDQSYFGFWTPYPILAKAPQAQIPALATLLLQTLEAPYLKSRATAAKLLSVIIKRDPHQIPRVFNPLLDALKDRNKHGSDGGYVIAGITMAFHQIACLEPRKIPVIVNFYFERLKEGDDVSFYFKEFLFPCFLYGIARTEDLLFGRITQKEFPVYRPYLLDLLLHALTHSNPSIRSCVLHPLSTLIIHLDMGQIPLLIGKLHQACKDPDPSVRSDAVHNLSRVVKKAPEKIQQLFGIIRTVLQDSAPNIRSSAVECLESIVLKYPEHAPQALALIIETLQDTHQDVQSCALKRLVQIAGKAPEQAPGIMGPLLEALSTPGMPVPGDFVSMAMENPQYIPEMIQVLLKRLQDPDLEIRADVIPVLGIVSTLNLTQIPLVIDSLLTALKDQNPDIRDSACRGLREISRAVSGDYTFHTILPPLLEAYKNSDPIHGEYVAGILDDISQDLPEQIPFIVKTFIHILKEDPSPQTRGTAINALGNIAEKDPTQIPLMIDLLLESLKDPELVEVLESDTVQSYAAEALEKVAKADPRYILQILEALLHSLEDSEEKPFQWTQSHMARIIQKITNLAPLDKLPTAIQLFLNALQSRDSFTRSKVTELLQTLSISSYWSLLSRPDEMSIVPIITQHAFVKKIHLFLENREGQDYLCFIENNEKLRQPVRKEQLKLFNL